jgi:hypothetical protein
MVYRLSQTHSLTLLYNKHTAEINFLNFCRRVNYERKKIIVQFPDIVLP